MSGSRLLLDTNAVVFLLRGESRLLPAVEAADWLGISVITCIEFLSFPDLADEDAKLFRAFAERVDVVSLGGAEGAVSECAIDLRRRYRLKLPDAVVAASALTREAQLVTADQDFQRVEELTTLVP